LKSCCASSATHRGGSTSRTGACLTPESLYRGISPRLTVPTFTRANSPRGLGWARGEPRLQTRQDGGMTETRVMTEDLRAAIERSGYYPGLVTDAVASALGPEPVTAYFAHHDAIFDPGMEVRRHMTVLALT